MRMSTPTLRAARPTDLDRMVSIEIEAAQSFPLDVLPAHLGRSGSRNETRRAIANALAWVAEVPEPGVVGFLTAQIVDHCLNITEMDVLPSHGRRGIGALLLEQACSFTRHRGLFATTLTTFEGIPWNAPWYARHGFVALAEPPDLEHLRQALEHERSRGLRNRIAMQRKAA